MLTKEKKEKLKRLLVALSSEDERDKLGQRETLASLAVAIESSDEKTEQKLDTIEQKYNELVNVLERNKNTSNKHNSLLLQSVSDFSETLNKKLEEIKELGKIPKGDVFGPDKVKDSNFAAFDKSGKILKDSGFVVDGTHKLTVGSQPINPKEGDIWIDTT
jgi:uncharacterized protein YfkK (UPF0435 family)